MTRTLSCLCGKSVPRKVYLTENVKIQPVGTPTTHGRAHQRCMSDQKGGRFKQVNINNLPILTLEYSNVLKCSYC